MTRIWTALRAATRRGLRDQSGSSTIETVLMLPVMLIMMTTAVELGVIMTRHVMLERALDVAIRDVRLGAKPTPDELKQEICDRAVILPDCMDSLVLDMAPIDQTTWTLPAQGTPCYNRTEDITPATSFSYSGNNEIMLIRACVITDPIMPWYGLGAAIDEGSDGQFYLTSSSAFVNEPK